MKTDIVFHTLLELEKKYNFLTCDMIHDQEKLFEIQEVLTGLLQKSAGTNQKKHKTLVKELPYLFSFEKS